MVKLYLPSEPTEMMATAGARIIGSTMGADNQNERAKQVWAAMATAYFTDELPPQPKGTAA